MLPNRATTVYSATKGALNSFTKALAFEVGQLGVRVNGVAPGSISTPQFNRNLQALTPEKQVAFETMVKEIYPLQHIGTPEDIAKACVFLASDNASWITGTVLAVDGGLTTN
jgi:short-chain dehydrogenase/reductase SDR